MTGTIVRLGLVAVSAGSLAACTASQPSEADVQRSFAIADRFQAKLQSELRQAIQSGGPAAAVGVCAEVAPAIAAEVSAETGASVRRISLRPRNPGAEVDGELRERLTALAAQPRDGAGRPATMSWMEGHGDSATHYTMRAVNMQQQPCGVCHGTTIADDVRVAITERYPNDRATGFRAGELRGAILIGLPQTKRGAAGE